MPTSVTNPAGRFIPNQGGQTLEVQGLSTLPNTNTSSSLTADAAKQNLAAAPDLTSLTDLVNTLNRNAQTSANAARIPNNPALEQASSANIANLLGGVIPQDVRNNLYQSAAERGVAMGSPGSDNANAALLRSLGLTSLDLQQLGQQNLTAADARNPAAPIFNPGSQLITPAQLGQLNNAAGFLGLDWYKALHTNVGGYGGGQGGGRGAGYSPDPTNQYSGGASGYGGIGGQGNQQGAGGVGGNTWWNSLFPSQPTLYGGGGNGFTNTGSVTTNPDGSTLVNTGQDWSQFLGDPFAPPTSGAPPNTVSTDFSSTYDPFSQYYGEGDLSGEY